MPTRLLHPLVVLVAILLAVSACQAIERLPADVGLTSGPLVSVAMRGGRCVDGPCETRTTLDASGRLVRFNGTQDQIPPERVARLAELIRVTDWKGVMARPFVGECQTAVDGMELVWTIQTPGGPLEIADCTIAVDYDAGPFRSFDDEIFRPAGYHAAG